MGPSVGDIIRFKGDGRDYQVVTSIDRGSDGHLIECWQGFNQREPTSERRHWVLRPDICVNGLIHRLPHYRYVRRNGNWLRRAAS